MQSHGTAQCTIDTGLKPLEQSERQALAHYWSLRILNLVHISGCTYQQAVQAVQDAMRAEQEKQS